MILSGLWYIKAGVLVRALREFSLLSRNCSLLGLKLGLSHYGLIWLDMAWYYVLHIFDNCHFGVSTDSHLISAWRMTPRLDFHRHLYLGLHIVGDGRLLQCVVFHLYWGWFDIILYKGLLSYFYISAVVITCYHYIKKKVMFAVCVCLSALSCGAVLDLSCFEVESSGKSRINEGTLPYFAIGLGGDMEVSNPWGYPQFSSIYGFSTKTQPFWGTPMGLWCISWHVIRPLHRTSRSLTS